MRRAAPVAEIRVERFHRDVRQAGKFLHAINPVERDQKRKPERAGDVTEDSEDQVHSAYAAQAFCEQHKAVLQISLAPAAFALGVFDERLRRFFVAAFQIVSEPDRPVFAEHQRGLDKIMRKDLSAERFASRQLR